MFRALTIGCGILPSLCFGAGISIELESVVGIGSFVYVDADCIDDNSLEECGYEYNPVVVDPEVVEPRAPTYAPIQVQPDSIPIAISSKPTDEGVDQRQSASVSFSYGSDVKYMQQYPGKLGIYSNNGIIHFYELDFETQNPSVIFDYVPPVTAESFSVQKYRYSEYNRIPEEQELPEEDRSPVSRFMPVVINSSQDKLLFWEEHPDESEKFDGQFFDYKSSGVAPYKDIPRGIKSELWPINLYNALNDREEYTWWTVWAFENEDDQGLWLVGPFADGAEVVSQQVSNISVDQSVVANSHWGLTQFFTIGTDRTLYSKLLEWSQLPTYEFADIKNVLSLEVTPIGSGSLLKVIDTSDVTKFYWWGNTNPVEVGLPEIDDPTVNQSIEYCDNTLGKIYCVLRLHSGEINEDALNVYEHKLYELVDGQLVFDRDVISPALINGFIDIHGIYAYGENRLLFINTLDLRHRAFNVMPEKTHYVGVSGSTGTNWNVDVIEDAEIPGVMYWVFATSGQVNAYKYTLNLNEPEPEPEPDPVDPADEDSTNGNSDEDFEERDLEEEEEERIIPRAELSGSLGWLIMLVLYAAYLPRRFSK